jgi:hypothetical protein
LLEVQSFPPLLSTVAALGKPVIQELSRNQADRKLYDFG